MLINVFGTWINPTNITDIHNIKSRTADNGLTHLPDCKIFFIGDENGIFINNKTADEVATEINKQLKGGKDATNITK